MPDWYSVSPSDIVSMDLVGTSILGRYYSFVSFDVVDRSHTLGLDQNPLHSVTSMTSTSMLWKPHIVLYPENLPSFITLVHLKCRKELKVLQKISATALRANILILLNSFYFTNSRVLIRLTRVIANGQNKIHETLISGVSCKRGI